MVLPDNVGFFLFLFLFLVPSFSFSFSFFVCRYTVNTNIALKANFIIEFAATGFVGVKIHYHTDPTMLDSMLPQPSEGWHVIVEFFMSILAIYLFLRSCESLVGADFDIFEWLNMLGFFCIVIYVLVSAYDRIVGIDAEYLRERMRDGEETGYYPLFFGSIRLREEVLLVASLVMLLQVFRYLQFFQSLSLVNGACRKLSWALLLLVAVVIGILLVFATSGMLMFAEFDNNFSSFMKAIIALSRTFFGERRGENKNILFFRLEAALSPHAVSSLFSLLSSLFSLFSLFSLLSPLFSLFSLFSLLSSLPSLFSLLSSLFSLSATYTSTHRNFYICIGIREFFFLCLCLCDDILLDWYCDNDCPLLCNYD